jgi:hypothetical protein
LDKIFLSNYIKVNFMKKNILFLLLATFVLSVACARQNPPPPAPNVQTAPDALEPNRNLNNPMVPRNTTPGDVINRTEENLDRAIPNLDTQMPRLDLDTPTMPGIRQDNGITDPNLNAPNTGNMR